MKKLLWFLLLMPILHAQGVSTLITRWQLDSALATLHTYTDTKQFYVKNDTLIFSDTLFGQAQFNSTDSSDTVTISGLDSSDVVTASPRESNYNVNDILFVYLKPNKIIVVRNKSGGTSGLKWNWIWLRKK